MVPEHGREHRSAAQIGADHVHLQGTDPGGRVTLLQGHDGTGDPGVVDQNINGDKALQGQPNHGLHLSGLSHIHVDKTGLGA